MVRINIHAPLPHFQNQIFILQAVSPSIGVNNWFLLDSNLLDKFVYVLFHFMLWVFVKAFSASFETSEASFIRFCSKKDSQHFKLVVLPAGLNHNFFYWSIICLLIFIFYFLTLSAISYQNC